MSGDVCGYTSALLKVTTVSIERERGVRAAAEDKVKAVLRERDEQIKAEHEWFDKRVRELKTAYNMHIAESAGK
jgi:hypothetical protein